MASADPSVLRVFYALVPPPALAQSLGELARDVARRTHGRPVPAQNTHMTLAFIGAWPAAQLPSLLAVGSAVNGEPMRITLDTQGAFRRAGVTWVAASSPPAALGTLAESLACALDASGVRYDARTFHPHVTLARHCRGPAPQGALDPLTWDADAMTLMGSQTRAEGARYTCLAGWPLH
jgi:RNA 2',3'-cyclic 3'-phosphodiesterase